MRRILCLCLPRGAERRGTLHWLEWCRQFTPTVAIEAADGRARFLLDIGATSGLFGGEERLARALAAPLVREGFLPRMAIADTSGAASVLARRRSKRGVFISPPGRVLDSLRQLPLSALQLPADAMRWFPQLGIETVEDFERMPREDWRARFGDSLLRRWDEIMGLRPDPLFDSPMRPNVSAEAEADVPATDRESVVAFLASLIERVAAELRERDEGIFRLECRLHGESEETVFLLGVCRPTLSTRRLADLAALRLERIHFAEPVIRARVEALQTSPMEERQRSFWSDDDFAAEAPSTIEAAKLADLTDRLSQRLGADHVVRTRLTPDMQPELTYEERAWAARRWHRRLETRPLLPRPLRLFERPVRLVVLEDNGDGLPAGFRWLGRERRIASAVGPERIETGWWRHRPIARDYYRVETADGARFWLFRHSQSRQWFLHGTFE